MLKLLFSVIFFTYFGTTQVHAVTGGEPAKEGEFPFMVSIRDSRNCHFCGGTIIGKNWILTANICYSRAWWGSVKFGSTSLADDCGEFDNSTQVYVDTVLYNPWAEVRSPFTHDLVLIRLNGSIPFSDNVQPVELPVLNEAWPFNETATILGWGGSEWSEEEVQLQKAEIPLYSEEYCGDPTVWDGWVLPNLVVMKCGGKINQTYSCFYDYGGPLLYGGKQFGIISYIATPPGPQICGYYLGLYSPVSYFRNWIKEITGI